MTDGLILAYILWPLSTIFSCLFGSVSMPCIETPKYQQVISRGLELM